MVILVEQVLLLRINQHVKHARDLTSNISFDNGVCASHLKSHGLIPLVTSNSF